ncbi:ubiquinone biosynthesis monooxygenase COQ6 [Rhodotorula toruloides]|uniref:Ubiquinone biosynthesis monooxygenase COQ6 n=1 Tax=Rhodotorula toruloides TaxID=5286 RepID=A0A511KEW9_RHOTO|nr:ubiquinone biosynthesis monooxygenase COQ6 [Rhodotorula toruloides]
MLTTTSRALTRMCTAPRTRPSPRQLTRSLGWFARATESPSSLADEQPPPPALAEEEHDVVIVGGGPAGLTLAAALASSPAVTRTHSITLIEGGSFDGVKGWPPKEGEEWSNRVSSITAENAANLARAGIWKHLDEARTRPITGLQVWDGLSSSRITFDSPALDSDSPTKASWDEAYASALSGPRRKPMSTMVENLNLQRAAWRRIQELQIGADGASSPVKSYSKIDSFGWPYDRHGVVATLSIDAEAAELGMGTTRNAMSTMWQRFLPEGPVAFLPLSNKDASMVWSTTPAYASLIKSLPLEVLPNLIAAAFALPHDQLKTFLDSFVAPSSSSAPPPAKREFDAPALNAQLEALLVRHSQSTYDPSTPSDPLPPPVRFVQPASVASFPLRLTHTSSYLGLPSPLPSTATVRDGPIAVDLRTVLVGDAAHTVHPLAGQGLNLGLLDAFSLSSLLSTLASQGTDLGSYIALKPYPRDRYFANHKILSACDHLESLFRRTNAPVVWARSTGITVLDAMEPLKEVLMAQAGSVKTSNGRGAARSAGAWGAVASVLENIGRAREVVGLVGGAVVGQVGRRAAEFIVKGR